MGLDDILQNLGLEPGPVDIVLPAGTSGFAPVASPDTEGTSSFSVAAGTQLDTRLSFAAGSVVIDNNTSAYINVPDATKDGTGRWVPPGFPAAMPILGHISRARINWTAPPGKVQPAFIAGESAQVTFFAAAVPPGFGVAAPAPIIAVQDIPSLAKANTVLGFNSLAGPFSDAYIMGWNLWVTNGAAAAQIAVAIKGDQSATVFDLGNMMALASGISSLQELLAFPIRVAKLLPNDTTYHVGIDAEAAYTLTARGQVYLGN